MARLTAMYRKPVPLGEFHRLDDFESGKPVLDTFLKDMAPHNQAQGYSRTFVIADADYGVVGYYSLCAGVILRENAPRQVKGHQAPGDIPAALLARLAVDRRHQGQGLGGELLRHALLAVLSTSKVVAFRAVMVHALDEDAARFYLKYGFRQAKGLDRTLFLPVKDIVASISA